VNVGELKRRLVEEGVPDGSYFIVGVDERSGGKGGSTGELVVAPAAEGPGWVVFSYERGERNRVRSFATESEAAEAAWAELQRLAGGSDVSPPPARTDEERVTSRERGATLADRARARLASRADGDRPDGL
jgi:hypothetical protein